MGMIPGTSGVVTTWAWIGEPRSNNPLDHAFAWALVNSAHDALLWGPLYLAMGPLAFLLLRAVKSKT